MGVGVTLTMRMTFISMRMTMSMFVEENNTDKVDNETNDSNNNHLFRMNDRRIIDSFKRFNEDIESNKDKEDSVDETSQCLESFISRDNRLIDKRNESDLYPYENFLFAGSLALYDA